MRTMYDACTASNIPRDAAMVAGYVDGQCRWSQADWDRFPNAVKVPISSIGTNAGTVLDVEPGNPNARQAVGWVRMRRAAGVDPTLYVAQWAPGYTWQDGINAFNAAGEPQPHYWVAPVSSGLIPPGAVAVQYAYPGPYDLNNVVDHWPGVDKEDVVTQQEFDQLINGNPYMQQLFARTIQMQSVLFTGSPGKDEQGNELPHWLRDELQGISQKVDALAAASGADPNALGQAVLGALKAQLNK